MNEGRKLVQKSWVSGSEFGEPGLKNASLNRPISWGLMAFSGYCCLPGVLRQRACVGSIMATVGEWIWTPGGPEYYPGVSAHP